MRMVEVYSAANYPEAGAIQALLQEHGIETELRGGDLNPLAGEIPFGEAQPALWVREEDFQKARAIIEGQDHGYSELASSSSEPAFEESAGESRRGTEYTSNRDDRFRSGAAARASGEGHWLWIAAAIFFFCTTIFFGFLQNLRQAVREQNQSWETTYHYGAQDPKSGCQLERWHETGLLSAKYCDNSGNGEYDQISFYGEREKLTGIIHDFNSNGIFERSDDYNRLGERIARFIDEDEDGFSEILIEYHPTAELHYFDKNDDGLFTEDELVKTKQR